MSIVDPEMLYEKMTQTKMHPRRAKCLAIINEICRQRFNVKATDWTIASIGRESELREGIGAGGLRLPRSEAYRGLITAWKDWADAAHPAAKRKVTSNADDWIQSIENVSSRQLVFALKSELARALGEITKLKKQLPTNAIGPVVLAPGNSTSKGPSVMVTAAAERACRRFVNGPLSAPEKLVDMGLKLKKDGDLAVESTGEVILELAGLDLLRAAAKLTP